MFQKLILLIIMASFLTGCGASMPDAEDAELLAPTLAFAEGAGVDSEDLQTVPTTVPAATESAADTLRSAEYFTFSTTSNTLSDDNGLALLFENQCISTFTSSDSGRSEWVTGILEDLSMYFVTDSRNLFAYAQEFVEQNGTEYFYSYSNYQQIGVARHDETVVSLISLSSVYSGGTHPNSVQTAYNLDISNRRILRLEDVITEDAAPALAKLVREGVDSKFAPIDGGNGLFDDYADTIEVSMNYGNMTPYWYLNDVGLVVFYNQYELGSYAAGIIKVELPYGELDGILLDEFYPPEPDGTAGDLILRSDDSDCSVIPISIEKNGQTLLIGVEGKVYQVQISEVFWLEDTPIAQNLIFSALSLEENDVLQITGGYTDESRSFAIEFTNGNGEHVIYYIHDGELSEQP